MILCESLALFKMHTCGKAFAATCSRCDNSVLLQLLQNGCDGAVSLSERKKGPAPSLMGSSGNSCSSPSPCDENNEENSRRSLYFTGKIEVRNQTFNKCGL